MSTKIYEAYKIPISKIGEYKRIFDEQNTEIIKKTIPNIINILDEEKAIKSIKEKHFPKKEIDDLMMRKLLNAKALIATIVLSRSRRRNELNIDCWINFFLKKRYAYVIHGMSGYGQFEPPKWAIDYSYWNNSDRPKNVSQRSWDYRGDLWHSFDDELDRILYEPVCMRTAFDNSWTDYYYCSLLSKAYDELDYGFSGSDVMWALRYFIRDFDKEIKENEEMSIDVLREKIDILNDINEQDWHEYSHKYYQKCNGEENLTFEQIKESNKQWKTFNKGRLNWILENDSKYGLFDLKQKNRKLENEYKTREIDSHFLF